MLTETTLKFGAWPLHAVHFLCELLGKTIHQLTVINLLSVHSPVLILSKDSCASSAKIGYVQAENLLKIGENRPQLTKVG